MKKIAFLHNLFIENKISIIEPSNEIPTAYLKKSEKSLLSAKKVLEINNFEECLDSIKLAEDFNSELNNFITKINNEDILKFRLNAKILLGVN
ncbi:MAG: hypothetical protein QW757_01650 [Candidatus Woesearchaeota archaeon]